MADANDRLKVFPFAPSPHTHNRLHNRHHLRPKPQQSAATDAAILTRPRLLTQRAALLKAFHG